MAYSYVAEPISFCSHAFLPFVLESGRLVPVGRERDKRGPGLRDPCPTTASFIFLQNHCMGLCAISGVENKT
jgi:hypothetical protein